MPVYYLDTSALVKLYVQEYGSEQVIELAQSLDQDPLAVLELTRVEFRAALRRRERAGDVTAGEVDSILQQLDANIANDFLSQPCSPHVLEEAVRILDNHPLRAYDAVQLAGALVMAPAAPDVVHFVCADLELLKAAEAEGLQVENPGSE